MPVLNYLVRYGFFCQAILSFLSNASAQVQNLLPIDKTKMGELVELMNYNAVMALRPDGAMEFAEQQANATYYSHDQQGAYPLDAALLIQDGTRCIVTFQGTHTRIQDFNQNLNFATGTATSNNDASKTCTVLEGYLQAYNAPYRQQLEDDVASCMNSSPNQVLYLNGHSQGGAIATVATVFMEEYNPTTVITGALPVIAQEDRCADVIDREKIWLFINTETDAGFPFVKAAHLDYDLIPNQKYSIPYFVNSLLGNGLGAIFFQLLGLLGLLIEAIYGLMGEEVRDEIPFFRNVEFWTRPEQIIALLKIANGEADEVAGYHPGLVILLPPGDRNAENVQSNQVKIYESFEDIPPPDFTELDIVDLLDLPFELFVEGDGFSPQGSAHKSEDSYGKKFKYLFADGADPLGVAGFGSGAACNEDTVCEGRCLRSICSSGLPGDNCEVGSDCISGVCDFGNQDGIYGYCD